MGKVVFYGAVSLDGYLADNKDNLQWLFDTETAGISTYESFIANVETVVMGRVTYDEVLRLVPNEPLYPEQKLIVFSNTRKDVIANGYFTAEDPVTVIAELKAQTEGVIWIVGGGELLVQLIEADFRG